MFSLNLFSHTDRVNLVATNLWRSYSQVWAQAGTLLCPCAKGVVPSTSGIRWFRIVAHLWLSFLWRCCPCWGIPSDSTWNRCPGHIILILGSSGKEAVAWTDWYRVRITRWSSLSPFFFFCWVLMVFSVWTRWCLALHGCYGLPVCPLSMPCPNLIIASITILSVDVYVGNLLGPFASDESRLFSWASPFPLFLHSASYFHRFNVFSVSFLLYSMIYFFPSK